jgi:hypothetical protein
MAKSSAKTGSSGSVKAVSFVAPGAAGGLCY